MDSLLGRSRHRKSDVVPLLSVAPTPPETPASTASARRASRVKPVNWAQRNSIPGDGEASATAPASGPRRPTVTFPPVTQPAGKRLNSFAQTIIATNRQQLQLARAERAPRSDSRRDDGSDDEDDDDDARSEHGGGATTNQDGDAAATPAHDPWSQVLGKVMRKTSFRAGAVPAAGGSGGGNGVGVGSSSPESKRMSLTQMLKSREVKDLVKQAIVTSHWSEKATTRARAGSTEQGQRSSVMEHWVKTSMLRHANPMTLVGTDEDDGLDDDDVVMENGVKSGFDLRGTTVGSMYGRTLLLEESCRRAFAQSGENRSQMDLQALKAWFQMTKLKITTDFERLQSAELDLLCRRMVLVHLHASEIVFRQGDEGDAMYILFAGCVEVKVAQRILGEKVEVTVCELSKGDYFGERALLHDDPRAATIVAKTPCELVRITRKDYNIMLKQDQQEFFSRMQLAGSVHSSSTAPTIASIKPSLLLPRSRSTLQQQTQLEYINVLSKKKHARTKADVDMLSEYLHTLKFFRGLPKTFVRELCTVVDFLTLPPNSYVFREGEVGDQFYIIFGGSVDVIVSSKDIRGNSQQTKLINLTEGAHFGELALMKGHGIRSATVLTREETKFLVICEKDYNSTLRRMQKEDLSKRVGVLDRIPMFQTPEWTGELLKEMSYVLSEQKLATGAVLFRQGEKALQVYFVVRGELLVTKEIVDPVSSQSHVVFVERIGRDRVVGDDAAAGVNFNEVIYREVTVTASTPVELLVLSKYDVFHRLSRAARETLRAAAHSHVESVVYLDRFHKTTKWDAYKQKLLKENLNHERMRKLLPEVDQHMKSTKPKPSSRATPHKKVTTESEEVPESETEPRKLSASPPPQRKPSTTTPAHEPPEGMPHDKAKKGSEAVDATQTQLVDANEFLLLDPLTTAVEKCFPSTERTLAVHVTAFNADAPQRGQSRGRQLASAQTIERRRQVEMLNEGNPLVYFDLDTIQAQQKQQQADMRGRAASSRRLLLRKRESPSAGATVSSLPNTKGTSFKHSLTATDTTSRNAMNQFFQDNFIFSHPKKPVETNRDKRQRRLLRGDLAQHHSLDKRHENTVSADPGYRKRKNAAETALTGAKTDPHVSDIEVARKFAEQLCVGDFVVVDVEQTDTNSDAAAGNGSPAFRIVRCCESLEAAKLLTLQASPKGRARRSGSASSSDDEDVDDHDASALFVVPKRKFALMPRATRPRVAEEAQQRAVVGRFLRTSTLSTAMPMSESHAMDPMGMFASYQKLTMTAYEQPATRTVPIPTPTDKEDIKPPSFTPKMFASVSIVLSKRELETAFCEEPLLCVHALYPSETEAMESALLMPPQPLKNALLCILPVGEWLHFDEAYDWCVQIETDRRDKHPAPPHTGLSSSSSSPVASPARRKTGSICGLPGTSGEASYGSSNGPPRAAWEIEKEKAQRLHQFVCTRMGLNKPHDKDRRGGGGETVLTTGFTPRPTVTLEDKLATLQDYLDTTVQASLGGKNTGAHVSILGKYRQMKRFGSIMRSRISAVSPPAGGAGGGLTGIMPGGG